MFFRMLLDACEFMLDLAVVIRMSNDEKDDEILLLRHPADCGAKTAARAADSTLAEDAPRGAGHAAEGTGEILNKPHLRQT